MINSEYNDHYIEFWFFFITTTLQYKWILFNISFWNKIVPK